MRWRPLLERSDGRIVRSIRVDEASPMPATGDVLVLGADPVRFPSGSTLIGWAALRVEGTQDRTVFYVPYPDEDVPLGASYGWRIRHSRRRVGRAERVLELRRSRG